MPKSPGPFRRRNIIIVLLVLLVGWVVVESLRVAYADSGPLVDRWGSYRELWNVAYGCDDEVNESRWREVDDLLVEFQAYCVQVATEAPDFEFPERGTMHEELYGEEYVVSWSDLVEHPELAIKVVEHVRRDGFFARLAELAQSPPCMPPIASPWGSDTSDRFESIFASTGWAKQLLEVSRMLVFEMERASKAGDLDHVVVAFNLTVGLAQAGMKQGDTYVGMLGWNIRSSAQQALMEALDEHAFNSEQCDLLLRNMPAMKTDWTRLTMLGNRHEFLANMDLAFSPRGHEVVPDSANALVAGFESRFLLPRRTDFVDRYESAFLEVLPLLEGSPDARLDAMSSLIRISATHVEEFEMVEGSFQTFLSFYVHQMRSIQWEMALVHRVAIEASQASTGRLPDAIEALSPEFLADMPKDPLNGLPFGYRRIDPTADPFGREFLLYTFGWDGTDDKGRMPTLEDSDFEAITDAFDAVLLRSNVNGFDFVFNLPANYWEWLNEQQHAQDELEDIPE